MLIPTLTLRYYSTDKLPYPTILLFASDHITNSLRVRYSWNVRPEARRNCVGRLIMLLWQKENRLRLHTSLRRKGAYNGERERINLPEASPYFHQFKRRRN